MDGDNRRKKIMELLTQTDQPVSGTEMAKLLGVSRQVIVQDIALLRAVNKNILSTNRGYIVNLPGIRSQKVQAIYCVKHTNAQIQDELNTIVDNGGRVLDVVVEHEIYGQITADLMIASRRDVNDFVEKVKSNKTKPLKELTYGVHFHTVEADSEAVLEEIKRELQKKGYLYTE